MLTVRGMGVSHQPVRIVMSRKLDWLTDSALQLKSKTHRRLCHSDEAPVDRIRAWQDRVQPHQCAVENGRIAISIWCTIWLNLV